MNYMIGHLHFSPEEALVPGLIQGFTNILGAGFAILFLPKIGGWAAMSYGLSIGVVETAVRAILQSNDQIQMIYYQKC